MTNSLEALIASMKAAAKTLNGAYPEAINKPPKTLLIDYINATNPDNVLSLIAALEQAQRANAAQDDHINQQAARIESLEKKNGELGQAYYDRLRKIAELEARQLSVKLPHERFKYHESDYDDGHTAGWNGYRLEAIKAIRAAGGTVEGSE
jgi:hypothetical protein